MVAAQAGCTVTEAVALMSRLATDTDRTLDEIAAAVVGGEIRFGDH
jgi:AmiR/NasT family two-component response regulator